MQREERLEIPYHALREALVNSLCHRRWEAYNLTNSIAIYDDRIEIANPGIFPPQITTESIKEPHESYPYNLKIAEALYKSMFLENWGSGAKRIMDACREQGLEEPTWSYNGAFVTVTFKRPVTGSLVKTNNDPVNDPVKISSTEAEILRLTANNQHITYDEVAESLNVSKATVKRGYQNLKKKGFVSRCGSDKTGYWEIVDKESLKGQS